MSTNQLAGIANNSMLTGMPSSIGFPYNDMQAVSVPPGSRFRVERISNGFLVHLSRSEFEQAEQHYAADEKAVGELVTATLVRWFIEGK